MKYNFNIPVLDLEDKPVTQTSHNGTDLLTEDIILGKIIAAALARQTEGDALKLTDWARTLHRGETLDLDRSDQETFKTFLKKPNQFTVLVQAQALELMLEAEKEKTTKK